jgi:homoserine dehydrogenase
MKQVGLGLLGFGTVGAGVVEGLQKNGGILADRLGVRVDLRKIADLDLERDRGVRVDHSIMTRDAVSVVDDPSVQVVVELIGGTRIARELILRAVDKGKPVVTANKALLAEHGEEIFGLARKKAVDVCFEASVCGGVPIIRSLREGLIANRIAGIRGILNGTCNYILSRMTAEGVSFESVLADAQSHGFAEADPSLDIDGVDTAHKAVILASLAYGFHVPMSAVHVEGIRGLSETDIRYAGDLGYKIKLLAVIRHSDGAVEVMVYPALLPASHMLASVNGVFNAVMVDSDLAGPTLYYGKGAGRLPTASAVIADVADAVRNLVDGNQHRIPAISLTKPRPIRPIGDVRTRMYLRMQLLDRPNTLARIAAALGNHGVSIASALQKESASGEHVPVVIVTHAAMESDLNAALAEINAMDAVGVPVVSLRIERDT